MPAALVVAVVAIALVPAGALRASAQSAPSLPAPNPTGVAPGVGIATTQTFGGSSYGQNHTAVDDGVNSATGAFTTSITDLTVAGLGVPFVVERTYNSLDTSAGAFGRGWSSILDAGVSISGPATAQVATVRGEDGQRVTFTRSGKAWVPRPGVTATLTCVSDLNCTVTRVDGRSWTTKNGRIERYTTTNGTGLRFIYRQNVLSAVELDTTNGPRITVAVTTAAGRVTSIATPTRRVTYGYTGDRLTSVVDVLRNTTTLAYDGAGRLTTITDPEGRVRSQVEYAADGRVSRSRYVGPTTRWDSTFTWDVATQTATRNALANVLQTGARAAWSDVYASNVLLRRTMPNSAFVAYGYDAQLRMTEFRSPLGAVEQRGYSPAGDMIWRKVPTSPTEASVERFSYDGAHRVVQATDALGHVTTNTYDSKGNLSTVTAPGGAVTRHTYVHGLRMSTTDPLGTRTNYRYDAAGNPTGASIEAARTAPGRAPAPNGNGTVVVFGEDGLPTRSVDARGTSDLQRPSAMYATTYTRDAAGRVLSVTAPDGSTMSTTYDRAGEIVRTVGRDGTATTYAWNADSRTRTTATSVVVELLDPAGQVVKTIEQAIDAAGARGIEAVTWFVYDATRALVKETSPAGDATTYTYDAAGNLLSATTASGRVTTFTYDLAGRPTSQNAAGAVTTVRYDARDRIVGQVDPQQGARTFSYTPRGHIASASDATGTTTYGYDAADRMVTRTDGNGNATRYTHDGAGRVVTTTVAGATWTSAYDVVGNVITSTDPDGRVATFTLDAANRRTASSFRWPGRPGTNVDISYAYDAAGRRSRMTDATGTWAYAYDRAGRLASVTNGADAFTYDYATPGKLLQKYPDGTTITSTFDDTDNVMSVTSSSGVSAAYVRDDRRRPTHIAYGNGVMEERGWGAGDTLIRQRLSNGATTLREDDHSYNELGERTSSTWLVGGTASTMTFGYGAQSAATGGTGSATGASGLSGDRRLTSYSLNGQTTAYAYDRVGNRTSTISPSGRTDISHDAADRITATVGGGTTTAWSYDRAGNVTRIGGRAFAYDAAGRLVTVSGGGSTTSFTYDGDGNRRTKTSTAAGVTNVTQYRWDVHGAYPVLALELDGAGALLRRYVHGDGPVAMQTPTETFYYHQDPLGGTSAMSGADGTLVATYLYGPFGEALAQPTTGPANPLRFAGHYLDAETGLYNMRARTYDPASGRFLQRDPIDHPVGDAVVSPYAYVENRPTVLTDPTGMSPSIRSLFEGQPSQQGNLTNNTRLGITAALKAPGSPLATIGTPLIVVGIGLQVATVIEACKHGAVEVCVGQTVGLAFTVGCIAAGAVTGGVGTFACAAVGIGLSYVITNYGPQIADFFVAYGNLHAEAFPVLGELLAEDLGPVGDDIADAFRWLGGATASTFTAFGNSVAAGFGSAVGTVYSGLSAAADAISSGFSVAVDVLVDAGQEAQELAATLTSAFNLGMSETIALLRQLEYDAVGIANSIADVFNQTPAAAAEILKGLQFGVAAVADALDDAYTFGAGLAEEGVAAALKSAGFLVNEVAHGLKTVYNLTDVAMTEVLAGVNYSATEVAGALRFAYQTTVEQAAALLAGVDFLAEEVAAALKTVHNASAQATAGLLKAAGYSVAEVTGALNTVHQLSGRAAAEVLAVAGYLRGEIEGVLSDVGGFFTDPVGGFCSLVGC